MRYLWIVLSTFALILAGCGETTTSVGSSGAMPVAHAAAEGTSDAARDWRGGASVNIYNGQRPVGTHYFTRRVRSAGGSCSGTQLTPWVILTAKHCVLDSSGAVVGGIVVSGDYQANPIAAARVIPWPDGVDLSADPRYTPFYKKDLALIVLASPVTEFLAVDFGRGLAYAIDDRPTGDEAVQVAGFGLTQAGTFGTLYYGDVRASAPFKVNGVSLFRTSAAPGGPHICGGDSGGPTYRVVSVPITGSVRLVGVHSGGSDHDCLQDTGFGTEIALADYRAQILALAACGFQTPCVGFDVIEAPRNVHVSGSTTPGGYLSWDHNPAAISVSVDVRVLPNGSFSNAISDYTLSYGDHVFLPVNLGQQYAFRVYFKNSDGRLSAYSPEVVLDARAPTPPTSLVLTQPSLTVASLSWRDSTRGQASSRIERKIDSGAYAAIATLVPGATTYQATLVAGHAYQFRVRAKFGSLLSDPTNEVGLDTIGPLAPTDFYAAPWNATKFELGWRDRSSNESGFVIEMKMPNGQFAELKTVAANSTWTDAPCVLGNSYTFRVRAKRLDSLSSPSNQVTISPAAPGRIAGFTGINISATSFKLTWTNVPANVYDCNLELKRDGGPWMPFGTIGDYHLKQLVVVNDALANQDLQLRTVCYNLSYGYGAYSDVAIVSTKGF